MNAHTEIESAVIAAIQHELHASRLGDRDP
jgi:hypothetical protein